MIRKLFNARIEELLYAKPQSQAGRLVKILNEFQAGFEFLKRHPKSISIFGSERCGFDSTIYRDAETLAFQLAKDGFTIITGGGHGVMEAANKGASKFPGKSVGLVIELLHNSHPNPYVEESLTFHYFFARKTMLCFASQAYVFFPGGFGTLDEFFELVMLIQTKKTRPVPIILVGKEYWQGMLQWIEETVFKKNCAISKEDMNLYDLVDTGNEAYAMLKKKLAKRTQKVERKKK